MQKNRIDIDRGLYAILIRRLKEIENETRKEIIPFPDVFQKICRNFSITKLECRYVLDELNREGIIKLIPCHGIKISILSS